MSENQDQSEPSPEAAGAGVETGGGPAATATAEDDAPRAAAVQFPEVRASAGAGGAEVPLERVYDLTVPVTVELGRATLSVQEILQLCAGSVVELDRAADAPVELLVHGKCVARGEIVVVDDFYGVRITSVVGAR